VAAVSLVDIGSLDLAAGEPLRGFDNGAQRVTVIRIAGHRSGVQHELATGGPRIGGDDGSLRTELIRPCPCRCTPPPERGTNTASNRAGAAAGNGSDWRDGEKKIFIPDKAPIVAYVPGDKSDLKPGAKVFIAAIKQPDGTLEGRAWRVGRDGVTPPM
jgi:hypothetical protein